MNRPSVLVDRDNSGFTVCLCSPRSCIAATQVTNNSLMTVYRVQVHLYQRMLIADASVRVES